MSEFDSYRRKSWLGADFRYFECVGSTNDLALQAGMTGTAEGLVILSERQEKGRGRLKRRWIAPARSSLLLSMLFRPPPPFAYHAARTTMLCGLALAETTGEITHLPLKLKWPNDLIVEQAHGSWGKVGGMLSEVGMTANQPTHLVVGIGLNVNIAKELLPRLAPQASSLSAELGHTVNRRVILDGLLTRVERHYRALLAGQDPFASWRKRLAWLGEKVEIHTPQTRVTGIAEDVDPQGNLLVRLADNTLQSFPVGDVSLRPSHSPAARA